MTADWWSLFSSNLLFSLRFSAQKLWLLTESVPYASFATLFSHCWSGIIWSAELILIHLNNFSFCLSSYSWIQFILLKFYPESMRIFDTSLKYVVVCPFSALICVPFLQFYWKNMLSFSLLKVDLSAWPLGPHSLQNKEQHSKTFISEKIKHCSLSFYGCIRWCAEGGGD